ncbi:hypothetical protein [Chryseobacterium sp. MEBOG07]|uniref:hypothetical protein n=1 Tax=Chryseobacterium sp. MEBOG07 TaxID=2879939 RepID=UPI001F40E03D|nr:hypothetical protein [Chryseobacterium sp. MEBOG07]UKB77430.1 hypothetical protein LF886_13055 [Chryseobacterium sp. MEBOG07]
MKVNFPAHWCEFIKVFTKKFENEIVYDIVRVFRSKEDVQERYDTYQFEEFLPGYIPVADDSGGQVALISKKENDTKVYISSYGVLQEELLKVLDRDLMHWMQQRFPFERKQISLSTEDLEKRAIENKNLFQRISSYPAIIQFLKKAVASEILLFPENYAVADQIYYFQDGYHYNSVENKIYSSNASGDFKLDWVVLGTNYFADPFFIDLNEHASGFPVYFAYHGQGFWEPIKVAENLISFQKMLDDVYAIKFDKEALTDYFSQYEDINNPFWEEVCEAIENMEETAENTVDEEITAPYWQKANLYITDIGPNKMKIIALLKKEHKLSGSEALERSKSNRILFRTGYYQWLQHDGKDLEDLGAQVEFEILE